MNEIKLEPYDDYETVRKKADEYISRILCGVTHFERYGVAIRPIVFISRDILDIIYRGSDRVLMIHNVLPGDKIPVLTIFGCDVKTVPNATNVLSVGFNLL